MPDQAGAHRPDRPDLSAMRLARWSAVAVARLRHELVDVHVDARAELLDQAFYSAERFDERLDRYITAPGFALVTAHVDARLVGYAFGSPLPADTGWWTDTTAVEPGSAGELFREAPGRTFAFREILVRKGDQGRGYAHCLHDALLEGRAEERATLVVRPDNPARDLYLRWGWSIVGHTQPFEDGPRFDAMTIPLPLR